MMFYEVRVTALEILCKEIEAIKKKNTGILVEQENIVTEIKDSLEELSRREMTNESVNFKTDEQEISSLSTKRKKKYLRDHWNNIKKSNIHVIRVQKEKRKI